MQIPLTGGIILHRDLLAIHMVRTTSTSTIVSYHPRSELHTMSAKRLQSVLQHTRDSERWSKILSMSEDPTFVFIAILGYVLYTWDEVFEVLYDSVNELVSNTVLLTHPKSP